MNFLRKLFGQKNTPAAADASSPAPSSGPESPQASGLGAQPSEDSVRVVDAYGREMQISKTDWRTKVLPEQLAKIRDQPLLRVRKRGSPAASFFRRESRHRPACPLSPSPMHSR